MDLSGRFTYVSPNIVRSHGYTTEEALRLNRRDTATPRQVVAGDLLINEELQRAALPTYDRNHMMTFESEQLRKDGTTFWAEVNASLTWSDEGRPVGITGVARDITERKRAEAEREKLWAQLSQAQKMESIGRLAGGVAHDFGNILSTMMLQIGVTMAGPDIDLLIKRALEELQTQAEGAANLIQQLLQFSRRSVMIRKSLDLNNVVANLIKMLGRLIGENISLRFEPHQGVAAVNADVGMMEQVIMNLAVNARDAMPRGGRLTIRIESVDVGEKHAEARPEVPPGKFICLSVSDTGCGMDEDTLKHIFEPFFTTKELGKGTGLGLSTVHGIVGQHQGWAEAESELGRGSTFRVFLPAAERPAPDAEQSETRAAVWGNETILLVEDAAKLREMIAESLRLLGYQVIEAGNGQEAMQKWQEHRERIDMLLSDIVLPGHLTGLELAEKFRESKPGLKIILSSSYSAEMVDDGRLSAGNMAYLRKPYRIEVLSKAIRDCFEQG
jgi:PAS domain S-box-containing protein